MGVERFSLDLILMSTFMWLTQKKRRPISLQELFENFIPAERKWEVLETSKVKMSGGENKKLTGTHIG